MAHMVAKCKHQSTTWRYKRFFAEHKIGSPLITDFGRWFQKIKCRGFGGHRETYIQNDELGHGAPQCAGLFSSSLLCFSCLIPGNCSNFLGGWSWLTRVSSSKPCMMLHDGLYHTTIGSFRGLREHDRSPRATALMRNSPAETPQYISSCSMAVRTINSALRQQDWESALSQLNIGLTEPIVAEVLRRQCNTKVALSFFEWVERQHFEHSHHTYKVMLAKLMNAGDLESGKLIQVEMVITSMKKKGIAPGVSVYSYFIDELCKGGNVDLALEHLKAMMSNCAAGNIITYTSVLCGLVRQGRLVEAGELFEEMEQKGRIPNVVTYSAMIHGLVKEKQIEQACTIFAMMKEKGCTPNMITYSSLIDGLVKAGELTSVGQLLEEMKKLGFTPSTFIYGIVINAFVKSGQIDHAWELFADMKVQGRIPNHYIYTPLIASLGKAGNFKQAYLLLNEMKAKGCAADALTYNVLIGGLVKAGKLEESLKIFRNMEADGRTPLENTYKSLIAGHLKAGQLEEASRLHQKMISKGFSPKTGTHELAQSEMTALS